METQNILVTGANGQLGSSLKTIIDKSPIPHWNFIWTDKDELDITNPDDVEQFFREHQISVCINCAAWTAVDKAEEEKELAEKLNADAVKNLAIACQKNDAVFIQVSTDYVYDGTKNTEYFETDITHPINEYGRTKLLGEKYALQYNPKTIIIRTSWLYSVYGVNFVKTMLRLFSEKQELSIIDDQIGSPTYAPDLAQVILTILLSNPDKFGVYQYCNQGIISWYDFAEKIKKLSHSSIKLNPIPTSQYPTPASRPMYSPMDCDKIMSDYHVVQPFWEDSLKECISSLKS